MYRVRYRLFSKAVNQLFITKQKNKNPVFVSNLIFTKKFLFQYGISLQLLKLN